MAMISDTIANPFQASVKLSASDIDGYVQTALARRGYSGVKVSYYYSDNGSLYDRFATPKTTITISGQKNGQSESEIISMDDLCKLVAAELQADGHSLLIDGSFNPVGVSITYDERDRRASGSCTLLVPRLPLTY